MARDQHTTTTTGLRDWPFLPARGINIVDADDCWLIDSDGRRILDAAGGAIVANVGHGRAEVADAIREASLHPSYVVPTWKTPQREALVERLRRDWLPPGLTHVHLTSGGSEGVESAVKIALQHFAAKGETQRVKIMARDVSYHGTTLATAALSGHIGRKRGLEGFLARHPTLPTPWTLRSRLGPHHPDAGAAFLEASRAAIEAAGPDTVAAILVEAVTGSSGGAIVPPPDYLPGLRALCDEYGILLIVDEVMTGFGRVGAKFAADHFGVAPDLLVSGKGLAGGYAAICGVFATAAVAEPIAAAKDISVMFHTFAALPSACAAADAVLSILEREQLVARAGAMGAKLRARLDERLGQHPHVAEVRGVGLLQAVEVVRDRDTLEPFAEEEKITDKIVREALRRGVFYYPGGTGPVRDILVMGPPFTVSDAQVEQMADTLADSIDAVLA
ncbi:MAG TPA: aminotransferase class III-fold pyridoxal phosphate-dependent enzyme [Caulobacteraceae bacterium]|nr:aminotransferase class III-fold pyridoxal phosphate-dependent enzyme [Caulobacteraceae bacterium]